MPADLEIGGALRAAQARWRRHARTTTNADANMETDERRQREPFNPERGRTYRNVRIAWQFCTRISDAVRHPKA